MTDMVLHANAWKKASEKFSEMANEDEDSQVSSHYRAMCIFCQVLGISYLDIAIEENDKL